MVVGGDGLPNWDSAILSGPLLSDTTAYRATVYRLGLESHCVHWKTRLPEYLL